jgi:hypothetical protein
MGSLGVLGLWAATGSRFKLKHIRHFFTQTTGIEETKLALESKQEKNTE